MLFELFLWGSLWFWAWPVAALIILCWCFEQDHNGGAIFTFFLFLTGLVLLTNVPVLPWIYEHTLLTLIGIGVYFAGIAGWMFLKWEFFTSAAARKVVELKRDFCERHDLDEKAIMPKKFEKEWNDALKSEFGYKKLPLSAREHKAKLMAWGINWPINAVWTVINDPVVRFTRWVYFHLGSILDARSKAKYDKVAVQFENGSSTDETDDDDSSGDWNKPWRNN